MQVIRFCDDVHFSAVVFALRWKKRGEDRTAVSCVSLSKLSLESTPSAARLLVVWCLLLLSVVRAMFSLRNRGGEAAALELASAFDGEDNSLFKHEVAYVLGQMQHPATVSALGKVLADLEEHQMVRHEVRILNKGFRMFDSMFRAKSLDAEARVERVPYFSTRIAPLVDAKPHTWNSLLVEGSSRLSFVVGVLFCCGTPALLRCYLQRC